MCKCFFDFSHLRRSIRGLNVLPHQILLVVIHVDQRVLQQRHIPQGNFTNLPTEVVNFQTETDPGGVTPPTFPLSAGPGNNVTLHEEAGHIRKENPQS